MASSQTDYYNAVATGVNVTTTAETVVATSRAISTAFSGQQLFVMFGFMFLAGAATTNLTLRIRQGVDTSGNVVFSRATVFSSTAGYVSYTIATTDQLPGDAAGQTYVCTVAQTAATGNGTSANAWSAITVG